jgi:hypothetical protein
MRPKQADCLIIYPSLSSIGQGQRNLRETLFYVFQRRNHPKRASRSFHRIAWKPNCDLDTHLATYAGQPVQNVLKESNPALRSGPKERAIAASEPFWRGPTNRGKIKRSTGDLFQK